MLDKAGGETRLPLMLLPDGRVLSDPTDREIADATGAAIDNEGEDFDVVIIGAGPAGLSAAVYGASEGLDTLVVDEGGIGGQATSSSLIRNYLGFPRGVSGRRLAQQAYNQAWVFGASFTFMLGVTDLRRDRDRLLVTLSDGRRISAKAVILAVGAAYRRLGVPALESLNGAGVFYGGAELGGPRDGRQGRLHRRRRQLGGAGGAAPGGLRPPRHARGACSSLDAGMSHYLVRELETAPNVDVRLDTQVVGGGGDGRLQYLELRSSATEEHETVAADGLFVLIGARPRTDWLPEQLARDGQGFLLTGDDLADDWPLERPPLPLETSMPGVFACGRCAAWIRQAGGVRGRRGLDRDPAGPRSPRR